MHARGRMCRYVMNPSEEDSGWSPHTQNRASGLHRSGTGMAAARPGTRTPGSPITELHHGLLPGSYVEPSEDLFRMVPDGVGRQLEHPGDVGGRMPLRQEERHFRLARTQPEALLNIVGR